MSHETLQHYNDAFRAFLSTLHPAQRRAVEATEGPVLVIAGPGTGKTHILTARIGNILLTTDARALNVLCLTFTDAGATAMRQRLLERIGPEAHRVPIFTFHAFCNRVIQENMEQFGKGSLEPATELDRIGIIRNLLTKLPVDHALREGKKDVFQYEEQLRDLFSLMKKEGWSPGFVLRQTDVFLEGLASNSDYIYQRDGKNFKKGDLKTARIEEMTEKMNRLKAAADLYPRYLQSMERAGRYEYEDMILWVTRAFEKNEALLRTYQERYQYVLVDEFQDTNGAQFKLLNLLLDFWQVPNVFIVGDDDQSIYEFQGARLENLREFYKKYRQGLQTIVLEENYRSLQNILDPARLVIENNRLRAVNLLDEPVEKILRAHHKESDSGQTEIRGPEVDVFSSRFHETAHVADRIEHLIKSGVDPSSIAVLYARHRQAARLLALLEKKGIPYQTKRPVNILDLPLVQQLRDLLEYLQEEAARPFSGEHRLFRLLHAAWWGLEPSDLVKIALACRAETAAPPDELYEKAGRQKGGSRYWREALGSPDFIVDLNLKHPETFARVATCLNEALIGLHNLALPQLLERLYTRTGLLSWALNQPDRVFFLQVLNTLMDFVQNESARNPRFSLSRLLDLFNSMDANKLALPLRQAVQNGPGVQLLTAHSAKGLEFGYVFMIDCTDEAWEKNSGGNRGRFTLPPTLTRSGPEDELEARRRLFYVAMTRAKRHLYISCSRNSDDNKPLTQARFIDEAALPQSERIVPASVLLDSQALLLLEATPPVVALPETDLLDDLLGRFTLSVTGLNRYLRCPLAFYYEDLLKIPGATSEAAAFGNAMHGALQQFVLKMKAHKKMEWPSSEALQRFFNQEMERQRGWFSEQGFVQRSALGREYLRRIHVEQLVFWRKRAIVERRVDRVELDGLPLTGILDKIEWLDNGTLRIVDYKTGLPDPAKTAPPDERQVYGGDYWRQLAFYKILLDKARIYPEPVGKTAISWLEPDRRGTFPIMEVVFSGEEIHFVENLIRDVFLKIRNREFTTGCGKDDCAWCRMHRDRTMPEVVDRSTEEGLDDGR